MRPVEFSSGILEFFFFFFYLLRLHRSRRTVSNYLVFLFSFRMEDCVFLRSVLKRSVLWRTVVQLWRFIDEVPRTMPPPTSAFESRAWVFLEERDKSQVAKAQRKQGYCFVFVICSLDCSLGRFCFDLFCQGKPI